MRNCLFIVLLLLVSTTTIKAQDPPVVEGLSVELASAGARLCWSAVSNASYYRIYERIGDAPFSLVDSTTMTCFENENYHPTMENCYYVTAVLGDGSEVSSEMRCVGPEALDFTAMDIHGNAFNLFEILDGGQYVFIDFFSYTCVNCRDAIPFIVESYTRYGCNTGDVFYVEINASQGDALCQLWCEEFGVEFPTISRDGGAGKFSALYHTDVSPHFTLIAPDHSIVLDGGHSGFVVTDLQSIIDAFEPLGIRVRDCSTNVAASESKRTVVYPNPADGFVNLPMVASSMIRIYNVMGQLMESLASVDHPHRLVTTSYPEGVYFIQADGKYIGCFVVQH
jgi:thiol-disulfide isomerase/thioredoxin